MWDLPLRLPLRAAFLLSVSISPSPRGIVGLGNEPRTSGKLYYTLQWARPDYSTQYSPSTKEWVGQEKNVNFCRDLGCKFHHQKVGQRITGLANLGRPFRAKPRRLSDSTLGVSISILGQMLAYVMISGSVSAQCGSL